MPELPEVQTVRKYLQSKIIGYKVIDYKLSNKKSLRNVTEDKLELLKNQKIKSVDRIAKHLIIKLEINYLVLHLRMEGKLFIFDNEEEMNKLTNRFYDVFILFTDKGIVLFQDTRRFATIDLFENSVSYENNEIFKKVGPEPFNATSEYLFSKISKKRIAIKSALLDQSIISGLGNIYVDEVLHASKILPTRKANDLSINDCENIINNSKKILKKAIESSGTTIRSYTSSLGVEGTYQNYLNVHQQKYCKVCKNEVVKIKVGGRGTYYCQKCQYK